MTYIPTTSTKRASHLALHPPSIPNCPQLLSSPQSQGCLRMPQWTTHPTSRGRNRIAYERPGPETIVRHPQSALASSQPLSCFHWILPVHLAPYLADPWLRRSSMNCQLRPLGNLNFPSTWDGMAPHRRTDGQLDHSNPPSLATKFIIIILMPPSCSFVADITSSTTQSLGPVLISQPCESVLAATTNRIYSLFHPSTTIEV